MLNVVSYEISRIVRGALDHVVSDGSQAERFYGCHHDVFYISDLGLHHDRHHVRDGGLVGFSTRSSSSLGRISEQILQGRRLRVYTLLVRTHHCRGRSRALRALRRRG